MKHIMQRFPECQHFQIVEVRNGMDKVIGGQCSQCRAVVWGVGKCAGCGKDNRKLTHVVEERKYCSPACRAEELAREHAGVIAARAAMAIVRPGR